MSPIRAGDRDREYDLRPMADTPLDPAAARAAWDALEKNGGLVSTTTLRKTWSPGGEPLRRQTVHELTSLPGFPEPVVRGGRGIPKLWLAADVDRWRREYDARARRGPVPRRVTKEVGGDAR